MVLFAPFRTRCTLLSTSLLIISILLSACTGGGGGSDSGAAPSTPACTLLGLSVKSYIPFLKVASSVNPKIINGIACKNLSSSPVVRVLLANKNSGNLTGLCSGTMISPTKVLTAEHCVENVGAGSDTDRVAVGYGDIAGIKAIAAKRVFHSPNLITSGPRLVNDIAVIELSGSPGLPTLSLLRNSSPSEGESGAVFGYGVTEAGPNDPNVGSDLVSGYMTVSSVSQDLIEVQFNGDGSDTCNGDSGGPLVLSRGNVNVIAGVVSEGSSTDCTAGDVTSYTNVLSPTITTWLDQVAPEAAKY